MSPKVLISDKLSPSAVEVFEKNGVEVDVKTGLDRDQLIEIIGNYDGLAIRSATKFTEKVAEAATNLKVIGRAGIGVDNVDLSAATAKGIIVMNTPFGNSITTAEHAISMMLALARQIPQANASTKAGKWEKSRFMGTEVFNKTLGLIGCGNIGSIVANRAIGLKMKVIAYDPFLSPEMAIEIGVEKVELENLLSRSDFVSLHTPLTNKTTNILDFKTMSLMKKGARIINCARGGLIVEQDLKACIESGHIAGAAIDVFYEEPAHENILFNVDEVICTPHLGASTSEAQENVAIQVAEQMSDYLINGAVTNSLNSPSISAEEAPILKPFVTLADHLGSFAGQLTSTGLKKIKIEYTGKVADMNLKALSTSVIAGILRPMLQGINIVSAPVIAKERGIAVEEVTRSEKGTYENTIKVTVTTEQRDRSVAGTVFSDGQPRIIQIKDIHMEAGFGKNMLYVTNKDEPGFIGDLGSVLGDSGINIASFHLGRNHKSGDAIAMVRIDGDIDNDTLEKVRNIPHVVQAEPLVF